MSRSLEAPPPLVSATTALFLDVDGTLLEFADHPDAVRVPAALPPMLRALHARLDGALALVSGRTLAQLDALFAPLRLPAAGLHGLQVRGRDGLLFEHVPPLLPEVLADARAQAARFPGALVEDKGCALALHWRAAADGAGAGDALRQFAEAALLHLPGYRLQSGKNVAELRPGGAHKGSAVAALMAGEPFRGRRPVFVGDDLTDEDGFLAAIAMGGHGVVVGERRPTAAAHALHGPADTLRWLMQAADEPVAEAT